MSLVEVYTHGVPSHISHSLLFRGSLTKAQVSVSPSFHTIDKVVVVLHVL